MSNLEPIAPAEAIELYIDDKQRESADQTVRSHQSRLSFFEEWCNDEADIDNRNELTAVAEDDGRSDDYRVER